MKLKYGPYSPSRLETATCGHAFNLQYVEKTATDTRNVAAERGSVVHEVYEWITALAQQGVAGSLTDADLRSKVAEAVNRHPAAYEEIPAILEMARTYLRRLPATLSPHCEIERRMAVKFTGMVPGWVSTETRQRSVTAPPDELRMPRRLEGGTVLPPLWAAHEWPGFEECSYDDPEAWVRGRLDIFTLSEDTTYATVTDHKTQPNVEDADTFQMGVYAWMVKQVYPFLSEVQTVLHFARYGTYSRPHPWTHAKLEQVEEDLMTRMQVIEGRTVWEATPHKGCQYCPHVAACPALAEHVEVTGDGVWKVRPQSLKILGSQAKAVQLASMVNVLEELTRRAKDEMKAFVKDSEHGVAIPGRVYGFWAGKETVDWGVVNKSLRGETYAIFEKYGIDPKDHMGFSQTFSLDVWKVAPEAMLKDLGALFPRTCETRFEGKKV